MEEQLRELVEELSPIIDTIPNLREFLENSEVRDCNLWYCFVDKYRNILSEEDIIKVKIIAEKINAIGEKNRPLSFVNLSKVINDSEFIDDFKRDWHKSLSGKYRFKKAEIQHYKTITEKIVFAESDFSQYLDKYMDCYHPYICSKIAVSYLASKKYDIGLAFLQRALLPIFSPSNLYWDNHLAMYGCTEALHEIQHILGRNMYDLMNVLGGHFYQYLEVLYLYLTRCIEMSMPSKYDENNISEIDITAINYFAIRADLVYHYNHEFAMMWFGVNPNIQVMSDNYMAYEIGTKFGLNIMVEQCHKDALKLYQHNSLIPNGTGGIVEMEDANMSELIFRGQYRAKEYALRYHQQLCQYKWLTPDSLASLMNGLHHFIVTNKE